MVQPIGYIFVSDAIQIRAKEKYERNECPLATVRELSCVYQRSAIASVGDRRFSPGRTCDGNVGDLGCVNRDGSCCEGNGVHGCGTDRLVIHEAMQYTRPKETA